MLVCVELEYKCQNYLWGKHGSYSKVLELARASGIIKEWDENVPYAELWLGTHKNGPTTIKNNNFMTLDEYISKLGTSLPYLFKVLSVNDILSIQAHPNKQQALDLHKKFPEIYKDSNYKPEMAIALSNFVAMCGFRQIDEFKSFVYEYETLKEMIDDEILKSSDCKKVYQSFLQKISKIDQSIIAKIIDKHRIIVENNLRIEKSREIRNLSLLFIKISEQYPNDFGCFSIYFLNVFELKYGEAIFIPSNVPHAYIFGDCIECMANSDNVIRLGLTSKFKDINTALKTLNFSESNFSNFQVIPKIECFFNGDMIVVHYFPPVSEFAIDFIKLINCSSFILNESNFIKLKKNSILLVLNSLGSIEVSLSVNSTVSCEKSIQSVSLLKGHAYYISQNCTILSFSSMDTTKLLLEEQLEQLNLWIAYPLKD